MQDLVQTLIKNADLSPEQAEKVAGVVKGFLKDRLPEALQGPVMGAISGKSVDAVADQAKDMLGKLF